MPRWAAKRSKPGLGSVTATASVIRPEGVVDRARQLAAASEKQKQKQKEGYALPSTINL